jgi:hypothetical protein
MVKAFEENLLVKYQTPLVAQKSVNKRPGQQHQIDQRMTGQCQCPKTSSPPSSPGLHYLEAICIHFWGLRDMGLQGHSLWRVHLCIPHFCIHGFPTLITAAAAGIILSL